MKLVNENKKSKLVSINLEDKGIPERIKERSLIITGDAHEILNKIYSLIKENKSNTDL